MKTLGALVAALFVLTACGDKEAGVPLDDLVPDETVAPMSDLAFEGVDWDGWEPVYGEMRPADEAAVAEISQRVTDLNASSWTAHEASTGSEISYTPEHVRMRMDHLDLHFPPADDLYLPDMTACLEDACSELDPSDDVETEAESLVEVLRGAAFVFPMQMGFVEGLEESLDEGVPAISTLDSPAGPVDCLVVGETRRDLDDLVGEPLVLTREDEDDPFVGWCVDQRGLVLVGVDEDRQVPQYDAWRPGVAEDAAELVAAPVVEEAPVDPTGDFENVLWALWEDEFADVHTATEAEVQALEDRVAAFNQTSWTGVLSGFGGTMSVSPEHVRVDMGFAEWHFDEVGSPFKTPYLICFQDEKECIRVDEDAEVPEGSPHMFNNIIDSMTFTWAVAIATQRAHAELAVDTSPTYATIDSPVGPLDCLVDGIAPDELGVDDLVTLVESNDEATISCVDQRGLVQLSTGGMLGGAAGQYTSWHAGVEDGFDEIPYRVRAYND